MGLGWVSDERVCETTSCFCYCPVDLSVQLSLESVTEFSKVPRPSTQANSQAQRYKLKTLEF